MSFDPNEAENLEDIEKQFAVKAVQQAQIYWSVLERRPGSELKLTRQDDEIYDSLKSAIPELNIHDIDEDQMKSKEGKEKWRPWMMKYEKTVEDYSFGTLLRRRADGEYDEANTIFVPRMCFYGVEILRNRAGINDWVHERSTGTQ